MQITMQTNRASQRSIHRKVVMVKLSVFINNNHSIDTCMQRTAFINQTTGAAICYAMSDIQLHERAREENTPQWIEWEHELLYCLSGNRWAWIYVLSCMCVFAKCSHFWPQHCFLRIKNTHITRAKKFVYRTYARAMANGYFVYENSLISSVHHFVPFLYLSLSHTHNHFLLCRQV